MMAILDKQVTPPFTPSLLGAYLDSGAAAGAETGYTDSLYKVVGTLQRVRVTACFGFHSSKWQLQGPPAGSCQDAQCEQDSATTAELVSAAVTEDIHPSATLADRPSRSAFFSGTRNLADRPSRSGKFDPSRDQVTDCKSILAIEAITREVRL